jgi:hypothetical protein
VRHPAGEIEPTNRSIRLLGCDYVKVKDGRVVSWHSYSDGLALLSQLGIIAPRSGVEMSTLLGLIAD